MQKNLRVFVDIGELLTLQGAEQKGARRAQEADLSAIKDAALVCGPDGRVLWCGPKAQLKADTLAPYEGSSSVQTVSLQGRTVLPGFVECHTHTVFAGNRAEEFEWRMQGQTYQEISAKGGGILSTVRETRKASAEELTRMAQARVDRFKKQGVTTLEIKSGYGLDLETELRCLRVARGLQGPRVITTYLGAHSRSPDHPDLKSYVRFMIDSVLPKVKAEQLADRVDIYIEKGFYETDLAREYLAAAHQLGLPVTAHVEQLSDSGGTELALDFQAQSVDHVVFLSAGTMARVASSEVTAVLLPTSDLYLKMRYPPARELIAQGARVALSTDYNPGTSPTQDLSLVGVLARLEMGMTLPEVLVAFTLGGAYALGLASQVGSLSHGKHCDFIVVDGSWRDLFYGVGQHPVTAVYRSGTPIL